VQFQCLPAADGESECYDWCAVAVVGNTAPAPAPPIAPGAAAIGVEAWMEVPMAKASMEEFSVSKASMHKFSMAKASMEEFSVSEASMPKSSVAKASASAPDEIDELRRLPYIGHNQARLHGRRQGWLSEQHGRSRSCRQCSRSHERSHFLTPDYDKMPERLLQLIMRRREKNSRGSQKICEWAPALPFVNSGWAS
jgi:hypothetical protein